MSDSSAVKALVKERVSEGYLRTVDYAPTAFQTNTLPTNGLSDTLIIDGDADFLLYAIMGAAFSAAATFQQFPNITINIRNSGSGRYLSQNPMHWVTIIGNAQYPFELPEPWFLPKTSNLLLTLANLSGAPYTNVSLTFVGVKLFAQNGYDTSELAAPSGAGIAAIGMAYSQ